jgi:hypothetical protein
VVGLATVAVVKTHQSLAAVPSLNTIIFNSKFEDRFNIKYKVCHKSSYRNSNLYVSRLVLDTITALPATNILDDLMSSDRIPNGETMGFRGC